MAGGIIYLDVDDEITSAASRIRTVEGSRGRGRAAARIARRHLTDQLPAPRGATHWSTRSGSSIVASDPATRALAASARPPGGRLGGGDEASLPGAERVGGAADGDPSERRGTTTTALGACRDGDAVDGCGTPAPTRWPANGTGKRRPSAGRRGSPTRPRPMTSPWRPAWPRGTTRRQPPPRGREAHRGRRRRPARDPPIAPVAGGAICTRADDGRLGGSAPGRGAVVAGVGSCPRRDRRGVVA